MQTIFGKNGLLQEEVPGYCVRENQIALAENIKDCIDKQKILIAEAGTGIGKTWAYLVPAILSGKKIIIATYTKVLQDQLFEKDLPALRKILGRDLKVALLKGSDNYLCLERFQAADNLLVSPYTRALEAQIETDFSGDLSELKRIPRDVLQEINVQIETCPRKGCPHYEVKKLTPLRKEIEENETPSGDNAPQTVFVGDCFFYQARRKAAEADVLVVNHHLFFSYICKTQIFAGAEIVIFDEAHHVPEVLKDCFSAEFDSKKNTLLLGLLNSKKMKTFLGDVGESLEEQEKNIEELSKLIVAFNDILPPKERQRIFWKDCEQNPWFYKSLEDIKTSLTHLCDSLEKMAERIKEFLDTKPQDDPLRRKATEFNNVFAGLVEQLGYLHQVLKEEESFVRFAEIFKKFNKTARKPEASFCLTSRPIEVGKIFQENILGLPGVTKSWIFTSATLALGKDFSYFAKQLNLENERQTAYESPFFYQELSKLYVPRQLDPKSDEHSRDVLRLAWPLIKRSPGGVFILCTSNRAYKKIHEILSGVMSTHLPDFLLLKQGDALPHELLEQFKEHGRAILVATRTFWEGVDVRGAALSLVIIDKLPFAAPDPVVYATSQFLAAQGKDAFFDFQLPQAAMVLKQGAGRLIRSETDSGVLMIGDPRFLSKNYRDFILSSLPPMPLTSNQLEVCDFLSQIALQS